MSKRTILSTIFTLFISGYLPSSALAQAQLLNHPDQPDQTAAPLKRPAQQIDFSVSESLGTVLAISVHPSQFPRPLVQSTQGQLLSPSHRSQATENPSLSSQPVQLTQVQPLGLPAQLVPENIPATPYIRQTRQSAIIPPSSAIAVTFCSDFEFNSKHESGFPITLFLARPILDSNGNTIAPVNSLVSAKLQPTDEGAEMKAESLVVGGRVIPIKTSTIPIPMLTRVRRENFSYSYGQNNQGLALGLANGLQKWLGNQGVLSEGVSDVLNFGLSVAEGVSTGLNNRKSKATTTRKFPERILYVLTLTSTIALPPATTQIALAAGGETAGPVCSESADEFMSDESDTPTDEFMSDVSPLHIPTQSDPRRQRPTLPSYDVPPAPDTPESHY